MCQVELTFFYKPAKGAKMNEEKQRVIKALRVAVVAERARVSPQYIYGVMNGNIAAPEYRAIDLANIVNQLCSEYGVDSERFTASDFNSDIDLTLELESTLCFNVHSIAFNETRALSVEELTTRFSNNPKLVRLLLRLLAKETPFVVYEGCVIRNTGAW